MKTPIDEAIDHFKSQLDKGMGDLEAMLAGIRYRVTKKGQPLDPTKRPPGYRSPLLRDYLRVNCGAIRTTKWGPTAIRGDLGPDKQHVIDFYTLVNRVPPNQLEHLMYQCGLLYARKVNAENPSIFLPKESSTQVKLIEALQTGGTVGKVQQGLVYATLLLENQLSETDYHILTKPTHAGDTQSDMLGDVLVLTQTGQVTQAYEVKGINLTKSGATKFLELHGNHMYPLFILALGFKPRSLQDDLNSLENTFAAHLTDFILVKLADLALLARKPVTAVLNEIIEVYNTKFCEEIEGDRRIKIILEE